MAVLVQAGALLRSVAMALGLGAAALSMLTAPSLAVFGGKPVADRELIATAVAAIIYHTDDGAHLCTATALGPRLFLTAAHCTDGGADGMKVVFATTLSNVPADRLRNVASIARAGKTPEAKGSYAYDNPDDVALIVLDEDAPAGTSFATLTPGDGTGAVRIAGYGATSDLRQAGLGKSQIGFDRTLRAAATTLSPKGPALTADQTHGAGMCTGDSGGPAYIIAGKSIRIAGVLIGVSAPRSQNDFCRGSAHFISVDRWRDWIVATAKKLGQPLP